MLLIHVPRLTNRLGYTLNVIFKHVLRIDFSITTNEADFMAFEGARMCYGPNRIGDSLFVKNCDLLIQTSIEEQEPKPFCTDGQWKIFPVWGRDRDFDFDPIAATFFMVSRYEEYLPHREDEHKRFLAEDSIACQSGFLGEPVVDQWACMLRDAIAKRFPNEDIPTKSYTFLQTVDIDAAWCYLHKGLFRTVTGTLRDAIWRHDWTEVKRRYRVLAGREHDPFDTFDYIIGQHNHRRNSRLLFFSLLAEYGQFDKPASYNNVHHRDLLQHIGDYATLGIHPGYQTYDNPHLLEVEIERLTGILHRPTIRSRYHFLRLKLPESYRMLIYAGIKTDYTMGYADVTGFRAGISCEYPFYDLERDHETELMLQPFCVMDTSMQKYMKLTPDEAIAETKRLIDAVKKVDGTFCCVVHNQNLCELFGWQGWRRVYEEMLGYAKF